MNSLIMVRIQLFLLMGPFSSSLDAYSQVFIRRLPSMLLSIYLHLSQTSACPMVLVGLKARKLATPELDGPLRRGKESTPLRPQLPRASGPLLDATQGSAWVPRTQQPRAADSPLSTRNRGDEIERRSLFSRLRVGCRKREDSAIFETRAGSRKLRTCRT